MVRVVRQMTVFATVLALSGSQAVLAACLAVCLAGAPASAAPHHGASQGEPAPASVAAPPAAHREHHGSMHTPDPADVSVPQPGDRTAPRLQAQCGSCCPAADVTVAAGLRAPRADAVAFAVERPTASWQRYAPVGHTPPASGPPVSPPPPVGALVPLRI